MQPFDSIGYFLTAKGFKKKQPWGFEETIIYKSMVKIAIDGISDDPEVQKLLASFDANSDNHLETKEVDADGDDRIDCNPITEKWMYTKLGSVENALFRAGLVNKLRNAICRTNFTYDERYSPDPTSPYFAEEKVVQAKISKGQSSVTVDKLTLSNDVALSKQRLIIVPDSHGDMARYNFAKGVLQKDEINFFAMEMIPHTMQKTVDDYIFAKDGSPKYLSAKKALENYFSIHWTDKFDGGTSGSPYFDLVKIARERKIRVIAMDVDSDYYLGHSQTDTLVIGTRNLVWANQIPQEGRGLIFGGLAHFEWNPGIRVQDFLADKIPPSEMGIVNFK